MPDLEPITVTTRRGSLAPPDVPGLKYHLRFLLPESCRKGRMGQWTPAVILNYLGVPGMCAPVQAAPLGWAGLWSLSVAPPTQPPTWKPQLPGFLSWQRNSIKLDFRGTSILNFTNVNNFWSLTDLLLPHPPTYTSPFFSPGTCRPIVSEFSNFLRWIHVAIYLLLHSQRGTSSFSLCPPPYRVLPSLGGHLFSFLHNVFLLSDPSHQILER